MNAMNCIDYSKISSATSFYSDHGYNRIEVPWWVTSDIANITKPGHISESNNYRLSVNGKCLIASGEQSFLYLANKGQLLPGRYQTITPCFRNEEYDQYHSKHFMKLELINLLENGTRVNQEMVIDIANTAFKFFQTHMPLHVDKLSIVETDDIDPIGVCWTRQLDIMMKINDEYVELGSYGARSTSFAQWIYGTGIAEPRFSKVLSQI